MKRYGSSRALASILASMAILLAPHSAMAQSSETSDQENDGNHLLVGAGVLFVESPFEGEGTFEYPLPIISAQFGPAYVEGLEAGLTLDKEIGSITPFVSGFIAARVTPARDRTELSADAGVRVGIRSKLGELSGEYRRDISGGFEGEEFALVYSLPISIGDLMLTPRAQINWLDQNTANHMYGVTAKQQAKAIRKERDFILPVAPITDKAMNLGGSLTAIYPVSAKLTLIGMLGGTYFDKAIHKSPAIDQKWESSAILAVAYSF